MAYFLGGPADVAYANGKDDFTRLTTVPAFFGSINSGHGAPTPTRGAAGSAVREIFAVNDTAAVDHAAEGF